MRGIFCDSFEIHVPLQSYFWTDDLPDVFKKHKGYDLAPHLLALWYDVGEKTPYLRHDFVHVLSQLIMDNFFVPLREWCEQNTLISRVQSHGSIGELLQSLRTPTRSVRRRAGDAARATGFLFTGRAQRVPPTSTPANP